MRDINIIHLRGRLGQDAEIKTTSGGRKVASLDVATSGRYQDRETKEWKDGKTEWHRCILWEKMAEKAGPLKKGDTVQVTGRIGSREYETDAGIKRQVWEIQVSDLVKLAPFAREDGEETEGSKSDDDEIPFEAMQ